MTCSASDRFYIVEGIRNLIVGNACPWILACVATLRIDANVSASESERSGKSRVRVIEESENSGSIVFEADGEVGLVVVVVEGGWRLFFSSSDKGWVKR